MNGNGLTARVAAGGTVVSEPVFKVAGMRRGWGWCLPMGGGSRGCW